MSAPGEDVAGAGRETSRSALLLDEPVRIERLKERRDFLRVASRGAKAAMPGLVLQAAKSPGKTETIRLGFTVSKKVGKAVTRNRARRRLREAAREILPSRGVPGMDYVIIGRGAAVDRPYEALKSDLARALDRVGGRRQR